MFDPFAALDGGLAQGYAPFGAAWEIGFEPAATGPDPTGATVGARRDRKRDHDHG